MSWATWALLPPVAAAIGWFTNFVAVRMIFRPYEPIGMLGLKVQGLLPKRKREFAHSIGETVAEHLVSADDIKHLLEDEAVAAKLEEKVRERIDRFLSERLTGGNPMLAGFLRGPFMDSMKEKLVGEVRGLLAEGVGFLGDHLDDELDMKSIVERKILDFDMHQLERIVLRVARKELLAIEILGAVLGFLVGVVQLLVLGLLR